MAQVTDLVLPLKNLTKKCIDRDSFETAESFCNLLCIIYTAKWNQLGNDEQTIVLEHLANLLHVRGLGDSWDWDDIDYVNCRGLVDGIIKSKRH